MTNTIAKRQNRNGYDVTFGNVIDNIFQNNLSRFFDDNFWDAETRLTKGSVPVNIRETEQQYEMDIIAPGCKKEDFSINVEDNMLTISLNKKDEKNQHDVKTGWVRNEYIQHGFSRSFTLDDTVDLDKINATYSDGILRISLGKNEKAKKLARNIVVK